MHIKPIEKKDDAAVAAIIRAVMTEYGANGPGFAIHDPEVNCMFDTYTGTGAAYFVLVNDEGQVVGGGGVAPLAHGEAGVCELRKMYFLKEARGRGFGAQMLERCLGAARSLGYAECYLETLQNMTEANALYNKSGFKKLCGSMGRTGHFGCDTFYSIRLR